MSPHGCYRCLGDDKWIAIAVGTDEQWRSLCGVLDNPFWSKDSRFADALSRWQHREELDGLLGDSTRERDQYELMNALQGAGVPAGAVLNGKQLLHDPHLRSRGFYETVAHHPSTGIPPLPYAGRPWKMGDESGTVRHAAPLMGEHNRFVLAEVLAKPASAIARLEREGVIGDEPVSPGQPPVVPLETQQRLGRILDYDNDYREQVQREYPH